MPEAHCQICKLEIELRHSVSGPKSKSQAFWSHLDDAAGIAADVDHDALR
jgi:hypothetical protein